MRKVLKFSAIRQASSTKARVGHLSSSNKGVVTTPTLLVCMSRGCVPHLTPDLFHRTLSPEDFAALCVNLEWLIEDEAILSKTSPMRLERLIGYAKVPIWLASRDSDYIQGRYLLEAGKPNSLRLVNGTDWVSLGTDGGIIPFNLRTAIPILVRDPDDKSEETAMQPEAIICPLDHYPQIGARLKRIKKSTDATLGYLKILQTNQRSAIVVLPSLHLHRDHGESIDKDPMVKAEMERRIGFLKGEDPPVVAVASLDVESLQSIPSDSRKAILLRGSVAPSDYKKYLAAGVDIFESSYATNMATAGKALTITPDTHEVVLDMQDPSHYSDFTPLSSDCRCIACEGPDRTTRSYIHHLVLTHEMLASVYLSSHNLWQCANYLRTLREQLVAAANL